MPYEAGRGGESKRIMVKNMLPAGRATLFGLLLCAAGSGALGGFEGDAAGQQDAKVPVITD